MKEVLKEIKDNTFADEWIAEYNNGMPKFEEMRKVESEHEIEKVGARIREMFGKK